MLQTFTQLSYLLRNAVICTDLASGFDCDFFLKWQTEERLYKINSGIILHVWFLVIFPKERVIHSVG